MSGKMQRVQVPIFGQPISTMHRRTVLNRQDAEAAKREALTEPSAPPEDLAFLAPWRFAPLVASRDLHPSGKLPALLSLVTALAVSTTFGCSTVYTPRATGHVAFVMEGGNVKIAKNERVEGIDFFGGGLVDAVEDNPAAAEEARTYRGLNIAGFTTLLGGAAIACTGIGLLAANGARDDSSNGAALGLVLGGLVAELVGDILLFSARPHAYDAVNIYNDGVDAMRFGPPSGAPYPYAVPPPPGAYPPPAAAPPRAVPPGAYPPPGAAPPPPAH